MRDNETTLRSLLGCLGDHGSERAEVSFSIGKVENYELGEKEHPRMFVVELEISSLVGFIPM